MSISDRCFSQVLHMQMWLQSLFLPPTPTSVSFFPFTTISSLAVSSLASGKPQRKWPSASEFKGIWELEICFLWRTIWTCSLTCCVIYGQSHPHNPHSDRATDGMLKGLLEESSEVTDMQQCEWMHLQVQAFAFCKV